MIHVVTSVHNRYRITKKFVRMLKNQTYEEIHLILVDDGSKDGTAEMVFKEMPSATILYGDGNLWWGGGLHMAYKWFNEAENISDEDYVMFANDDVEFDELFLQNAILLLKSKSDTLLTGYGVSIQTGKQVDGAVNLIFPEGGGHLIEEPEAYGNCATTHSLFLRVKDLKKIGGFHPIVLPHYGSDYEWTYRASKKGYMIYCTDCLRYFVNEATTGYKKKDLKTIFSKKSVSNPLYKISFVFLAAPTGKKVLSVLVQMGRFIKRYNEVKK